MKKKLSVSKSTIYGLLSTNPIDNRKVCVITGIRKEKCVKKY